MAKYECKVCGYIYNEQHAGRPFEELSECPICNESKANFIALDADNNPVVEEKAEEQAEPMEEKAAEPFDAQEEESVEEVVSEKTEEAAPFSVEKEEKEEPFSIYKEVKEDEDVKASSDFVVERRQEFWSPLRSEPENKPVSNNTTGWTISNARGSVETVIGGEEKKEEAPVVQEVEKEDDSPFGSRIESFYSSSEPVGMSHIVSGADEEEEPFKPLWNSGGGTVQRVIDPFGDKNEPVVKAENIGMVMPAEEPVVEEIFNGEDDVEENATSEPVEVKEFFDEEAVEAEEAEEPQAKAVDAVIFRSYSETEDVAEKIETPAADDEDDVFFEDFEEESEEPAAEEPVVAEETAAEEIVEEPVVEEETVAEEEPVVEEYPFRTDAEDADDELNDDDFFTEMTIDAVVEPVEEAVAEEEKKESLYDNPDYIAFRNMMDAAFPEDEEEEEHHGDSSISEEDVFKAIDAIEFDDDVPEGGRIEVVTGEDAVEGAEEAVEAEAEEVASEIEVAVSDEDDSVFFDDEEIDVIPADVDADDFVDESEDAPVEAAEEAEAVEEVEAEETVEAENVEAEAEDEAVEADAEETKTAEEPRIKSWSFLDDVVEAGAVTGSAVAGVNFVSKAMDEVVEEEVTEEDIEELFVDFAEEKKEEEDHEFKANLAEELYEAEESISDEMPEEECVSEEKETAYCNNLEKILIVPAQLNPMPLPEGTAVEGRTVLGIASERPLVLDNPVFSTGAYNMVQYIPNSGLTSEDYQKADAIEIIVGHGNGIEKTINSKEDLRQVVNFLRLESDGCPIGIKMGAARIERDLEFCVFAKPDYVVLNNFSVVPLPYALHRATKYLNTVQSDMDIVIALDGAKDAEELAKIMAMGADVIALRNRPANMNEMIDGLKNYARLTGHYDVEDLNVKDLCTTDREIAEYTDIYHV